MTMLFPKSPRPTKPKADPANFRKSDVEAVYGSQPRCFITNEWQNVDAAHILGRGYSGGYNKSNPDRSMFSSIFGFCPLSRRIHAGPQRDSRELRHLFLRLARERVMLSVQIGEYELRPEDEAFLQYAAQWLLENPC